MIHFTVAQIYVVLNLEIIEIHHGHLILNLRNLLFSNNCFSNLQVGVKGNPKGVNRGMDCDVIVAEVCMILYDQIFNYFNLFLIYR